jgi:hypothetical protein
MQAPIVIDLTDAAGFGLIVARPTGVSYFNQVGGVACLHKSLEGFYVPFWLNEEQDDLEPLRLTPLANLFVSLFGECGYYTGIDEKMADEADALLASRFLTRELLVDRTRLAETNEAWVWVTGRCEAVSELGEIAGVLTWQNSD